MALFGNKDSKKEDKTKNVPDKKTTQKQAPKALATDVNLDAVLIRPHLTEKSVSKNEESVYTFEVRRDANKYTVRDAIKSLYNVTPVKVNIVNKQPAKRLVGSRGSSKHVAGKKKAYVYLKKGDSINVV